MSPWPSLVSIVLYSEGIGDVPGCIVLMVFHVRDGSSNIRSHLYEPENFCGKRVILHMQHLLKLKKRYRTLSHHVTATVVVNF